MYDRSFLVPDERKQFQFNPYEMAVCDKKKGRPEEIRQQNLRGFDYNKKGKEVYKTFFEW